jgi:hypothetical protein
MCAFLKPKALFGEFFQLFRL